MLLLFVLCEFVYVIVCVVWVVDDDCECCECGVECEFDVMVKLEVLEVMVMFVEVFVEEVMYCVCVLVMFEGVCVVDGEYFECVLL